MESFGESSTNAKAAVKVASPVGVDPGSFPSKLAKSFAAVVSGHVPPTKEHEALSKVDVALSYFPPSRVNGRIRVKLPKSVSDVGERLWRNTLVGYFLGRIPPFLLVQRIAKSIWGNEGLLDVLSNGHGYFLFKFNDETSLLKVLRQP